MHVASLDGKKITGWDEKNLGKSVPANRKIADVSASDYDAIMLPGGQINPDLLRAFFDAGKTVAAICHAPWQLIEACIAKGRKLTSYPSIRTDVENAGSEWHDREGRHQRAAA